MQFSQKLHPPFNREKGFTLIELLTVIAIIGILAAILIPVVGKARDSAARATDVSHLRQIGLGIHLYADDNEGRLPGPYYAPILHSTIGSSSSAGTKYFTDDMASYLQQDIKKGDKVLIEICISEVFRRQHSEEEVRNGMSYRLNTADSLFGNNSDTNLPNPYSLDSIEDQSVMWMVMDVDRTIYVPGTITISRSPLYGATRNVLYVDGHIGQVSSKIRPKRGELLLPNTEPNM